jgi:hypothetical protein
MIINHIINVFVRLQKWDSASMLGLANVSGTWKLGPHVNWPEEQQFYNLETFLKMVYNVDFFILLFSLL